MDEENEYVDTQTEEESTLRAHDAYMRILNMCSYTKMVKKR